MEPAGLIPRPSRSTTVTHMRALCTELWNLRAEGAFCDVILTIQGEHLSAHSVVLSACSPHLKKICMDRSSITPSGVLNIHIDDFSYKVCIKTLEFLYTGERICFEETGLEKEFERLAKEWKLFGSAFRVAESVEEENQYLASISDESDETDGPVKKNTHGNQSQKPNIEMNNSSKKDLEPSSAKCLNKLDNQKARLPVKKKAPGESIKPQDSHNEPSEDQVFDTFTEDISDDLLQLHRNLGQKGKDQTPTMVDSVEGKLHSINTGVQTIPRKKKQKKVKKSLSVQSAEQTVKSIGGSIRNASKEGGRRGKKNNCYRCDIQFDSREAYLEHGKEVHPRKLLRIQDLTCKICNARFYHFNLLRIHKLENHWEEGMKPAKVYKCDFENCTYTTLRYAAFNAHKKGHTAPTCICNICGKVLKHSSSLKFHMESIHEKKHESHCSVCNKTFKTRKAFKNHNQNLHHGKSTRLICSTCGYVCKEQSTLKEHMLTSHNEQISSRVFYCSTCNFKTTQRRKHTLHERTHNPEPLQCEECGKSYSCRNSLSLHMRIHNNTAKVYKCNYCDYKTVFGVGTLRKHLNAMHKDKEMKPWKCTDCTYSAMTKDILDGHLVSMHGYPVHQHISPQTDQTGSTMDQTAYKDPTSVPPAPAPQPVPHTQQQGVTLEHNKPLPSANLPPPPTHAPQIAPQTSGEIRHPTMMPTQNHMHHQETVTRPEDKALPPMPVISRTGPPGFVDVPLNYSLFRTAAAAAANQNFSHHDPTQPTSSQVLMVPGQLGQPPMLPSNLNPLHDWGDFQSF